MANIKEMKDEKNPYIGELTDNLEEFIENIKCLKETYGYSEGTLQQQYKEAKKAHDDFLAKYSNGKYTQIPSSQNRVYKKLEKRRNRAQRAFDLIPPTYIISLVSLYDSFYAGLIRCIYHAFPEKLQECNKQFLFRDICNLESLLDVKQKIVDSVIEEVAKMKPLEKTFSMYKDGNEIQNSFTLFGNIKYDYILATNDPYLDGEALVGHSLKKIPWYTSADNLYATTYITYHNKKYIPFVNKLDNGMVLIICLPKSEMFKDVNRFYLLMILTMLGIALLIPALLYYSLNRYIMNPIDKLTKIAHKIGKGEDVTIKIERPEEFAQLASTFDKMTKNIKLITHERAKINSELSIAKSIQSSSLPNVFPPFPDRSEFDIFASMEAAKEVGGDFYDFFFIDKTKFMYLIADVSGKGIPAALFMMTVKTLINNLSQLHYSPKKLIETINNKIYQTNKQGFFVTVLIGIVDINTGETSIINCGHNLPLIKRQNGSYEYMQLESNLPLGIFEDNKFEIYETILQPGDIIYAYTDGVTEAINDSNDVYGEERLSNCLNNITSTEPSEIAQSVKKSIKEYTDLQSDDITMLIFKYNGPLNNVRVFKEIADKKNYSQFYNWLKDICREWNINAELTNKLDMCAEEIFANISFYAYPENAGMLEAILTKSDENITFEFRDEGVEYNPIEKPDPDINLPPEERPLGGLGIYMIKQMADNIAYKRENDKNILTLTFKL